TRIKRLMSRNWKHITAIWKRFRRFLQQTNTCLVETDDCNVTPDSPDMCDDVIQNDQNDVDSDDERVTLANLIDNLKLDVNENKKIQKQLKKANTTLAQELKECKTILAETSKTLGSLIAQSEIPCLYAFPYDQSTHANRLIPDGEETLALERESRSKLNKDSVPPYDYTTLNSLYEIFKPPTQELKAQSEIPCLYTFPYDQSTHANRLIPDGEETLALERESRSKLNKDSVPPYDYTTLNNALAELQCLYLHKVKECDCLAQKLSKQTESVSIEVHTELSRHFAKLEKHSIFLKLALQKYLKAQLQDKNIAISELKKLTEKGKGKFVETKFDKPSIVRQPKAQWIPEPSVLGKPAPFLDSLARRYFSMTKSFPKTNVLEGLSKPVTTQTLPQTARQAVTNINVLKPGMYQIDNRTTQTRAPHSPQNFRNTNPRMSTSIGVNHKTNVSRPQHRSNQTKDKVVPNNSQVKLKKTQVEEHPRIPSISNKIKSVTACNDSLNSRTSNVNVVCATLKMEILLEPTSNKLLVGKFLGCVLPRTQGCILVLRFVSCDLALSFGSAFCLIEDLIAFFLGEALPNSKPRCVLSQSSENRPPRLNKDSYVPWSSRIIRYARSRPNGELDLPVPVPESFHEQTDEELIETDIKRMDADDQAIQTILLSLPEDVYSAVDSYETAKEIWERVRQMMKGSDIEEQEKKAKLFNEWEKFTSTDDEPIESYYHHFMQLINDLKRNKHFPENIASNLKFLNNLQPEWKRYVTIVRQTKNLHETDFTQIYDFLKMNQDEVNELRVERLAKSHDPLALMAHSHNSFNFSTTHKDQSSSNINDPTEAMNATLILFAKAFQLSAPTNNNQRTTSNPRNRQLSQPVMNIGQDTLTQNVGGNGGNQFGQYDGKVAQNQQGFNAWQNGGIQGVQNAGIANQSGTGNVVVARAEGTGNENQARAPVYDIHGSAEVQLNDNYYDNEIFNMFTQEEQYMDLLEPIP
nr:hypothetical protein [Tanacetum cinerariifolium]